MTSDSTILIHSEVIATKRSTTNNLFSIDTIETSNNDQFVISDTTIIEKVEAVEMDDLEAVLLQNEKEQNRTENNKNRSELIICRNDSENKQEKVFLSPNVLPLRPRRRRKRGRDVITNTSNTTTAANTETTALESSINSTDTDANCVKGVAAVKKEKKVHFNLSITEPSSSSTLQKQKQVQQFRVALLHSISFTNICHEAMSYIHNDRDILLSSLLDCCGFLYRTPSFLTVVEPTRVATRKELENVHDADYLNMLHYPPPSLNCNNEDDHENANRHDDDKSSCCILSPEKKINNDNSSAMSIISNNNPSQLSLASLLFRGKLKEKEAPVVQCDDFLDQIPTSVLEQYNLIDDNPLPCTRKERQQLWTFLERSAGAAIQAASLLDDNDQCRKTLSRKRKNKQYNSTDTRGYQVAIQWFGSGRHHAQPSRASGFCYINDVILAIHRLLVRGHRHRRRDHRSSSSGKLHCQHQLHGRNRVLYMDIDIHHGDAVQNYFYTKSNVLTVSFHRYSPGFFPDSGGMHERGKDEGLGYNLNLQLPIHLTDDEFKDIYNQTLTKLISAYQPHALVLVVGADGLKRDPLITSQGCQGWNLSPEGLAEIVKGTALTCAKPPTSSSSPLLNGSINHNKHGAIKLLLLGGGGYNDVQTARTFTLCSAAACAGVRKNMVEELPRDVPRHDYFDRYGPDFLLQQNAPFVEHVEYDDENDEKENISISINQMHEPDRSKITTTERYNQAVDESTIDDENRFGAEQDVIHTPQKQTTQLIIKAPLQKKNNEREQLFQDCRNATNLTVAFIQGRKEQQAEGQQANTAVYNNLEKILW